MKYRNRRDRRGDEPLVDTLFAEALAGRRRESSHAKDDRKAQQLCRQVQRALCLAFAGECGDELIRDLLVDAVVPAPNASRLLVRVALPASSDVPMHEVLERLSRVHGRLRYAVAEAICRKRVPELIFIPVMSGEVQP